MEKLKVATLPHNTSCDWISQWLKVTVFGDTGILTSILLHLDILTPKSQTGHRHAHVFRLDLSFNTGMKTFSMLLHLYSVFLFLNKKTVVFFTEIIMLNLSVGVLDHIKWCYLASDHTFEKTALWCCFKGPTRVPWVLLILSIFIQLPVVVFFPLESFYFLLVSV